MSLSDYKEAVLPLLLIVLTCVVVSGILTFYIGVWMVAVCWLLAQFGYTFSGLGFVIPFCLVMVLHFMFVGRRSK